LERELSRSLAEVLYLAPQEVAVDTAFTDLGLDSVIAVEWIRALAGTAGGAPTVADLYDHPTVRALAAELARRGRTVGDAPESPVLPGGPAPTVARAAPEPPEAPVPPALSAESLEAELSALLAEVLYLEDTRPGPQEKFADLGLDSVLAVEWVGVLNRRYGAGLQATDVYDHPTVADLARHLAARPRDGGAGRPVDLDAVLRLVSAGDLDLERAEELISAHQRAAAG
jgi:acyl carrier protein